MSLSEINRDIILSMSISIDINIVVYLYLSQIYLFILIVFIFIFMLGEFLKIVDFIKHLQPIANFITDSHWYAIMIEYHQW